MAFSIKVSGFEKVEEQLAEFRTEGVLLAFNRAMKEEAAEILAAAKQIVPFDTGRLHDSGHTENAGRGRNQSWFIRFDAPYAFKVHESTEIQFRNGKQSKYLETAYFNALTNMVGRVAQRIAQIKGI